MSPPLDDLRDLAIHAAAEAAAVHRHHRRGVLVVTTKASPTDVVTEADREAERLIVQAIAAARPDDGILAEEGATREGTSGVRWIVDPLDGTTNYVYGWPAWAVSIGVEIEGRAVLGVVHDTALERLFVGVAGRGATLNGEPIAVRDHPDLATALIATGFQYVPAHRARQAEVLRHVLPRVRDVRRGGSAAIDLCSVAAGLLDAYYELGLGEWDVAAGSAIAEAAGARVVSIPVAHARGPLVVAAGPRLAEALLALLREAGALEPMPSLV